MTHQLNSLLWQAVESDATLRNELADRYGMPGASAKKFLEDNSLRLDEAAEAVAQSSIARTTYQRAFSILNQERAGHFSPAHDALAELIHRRSIDALISFNWDTLLEVAYRRRYGQDLKAGGPWLYKPHGDAAHVEDNWILPHESGYIPDAIVAHVQALTAERPRILLVVGYSGSDEVVVNKVIGPLSARWRVIRIGPNVSGEYDIALPAEEALPALVRAAFPNEEVPGWEYVGFDNQHDLSNALTNQGMGPSDVKACPELPEVARIIQRLSTTKHAELSGKSGSGKSLAAYQAACYMNAEGWEIIRLTDSSSHSAEVLVGATRSLPNRTLAIIDNAQSIDPLLPIRMINSASDKLSVLTVWTEDVPTRAESIPVVARRAVNFLAEAFEKRSEEILPIVSNLDPSIGSRVSQIGLKSRIEEAAKSDTPWQFCFVLTGGWQRAKDDLAFLQDHDRADLLLAAVAIAQVVTTDAGIELRWLRIAADTLGYNEDWMHRSLSLLRGRRTVLGNEKLRCPHLRYAGTVIEFVCNSSHDPLWQRIVLMLRNSLVKISPPLLGINWLLHQLRFSRAFRMRRFDTVLDSETWRRISERCWSSNAGEERRDALFVLNTLRDWHPDHIKSLEAHTSLLGEWLEQTSWISAAAFGNLLNALHHDMPQLTEAICEQVDPKRISLSVAQATSTEIYSWGSLLGRLCATSSSAWRKRLNKSLDRSALLALSAKLTPADLYGLNELFLGLMGLDYNLALAVIEQAVPMIVTAMNADPANTFGDMFQTLLIGLGLGERISKRQYELVSRLAHDIDPDAIAKTLAVSSEREWQNYTMLMHFINAAAPTHARKIADAIDFTVLDQTTEGYWQSLPFEFERLVDALALPPNSEPARSWVNSHREELERVSPILAIVAPSAVVYRLHAGLQLDLDVEHGLGWERASKALKSIAKLDKGIAGHVCGQNSSAIAKGFTNGNPDGFKGIQTFATTMKALAPAVLEAVLVMVDINDAETQWTLRLHGNSSDQLSAERFLKQISLIDSPVKELALRLINELSASQRVGS